MAIEHSFWLDSSTSNKLTELNVFLLNNIGSKINEDWDDQQQQNRFQELGSIHWENIRAFRKELQLLINSELKSLHKIDLFFKNNSSRNVISFPILKSDFRE